MLASFHCSRPEDADSGRFFLAASSFDGFFSGSKVLGQFLLLVRGKNACDFRALFLSEFVDLFLQVGDLFLVGRLNAVNFSPLLAADPEFSVMWRQPAR